MKDIENKLVPFVAKGSKVESDKVPAKSPLNEPTGFEPVVVDLDNLDVHEITRAFLNELNQSQDTGILRSHFKKWKYNAQHGKLDKMNIVLNDIRNINQNIQIYRGELAQRKTTALFNQIKIYKKAEQELQKMVAQHEADMLEIEEQQKRSLESTRNSVLSNNVLETNLFREQLINELIKKVVDQFDITKINFDTMLFLKNLINTKAPVSTDVMEWRKFEANLASELAMKEQDVRIKKSQADVAEAKGELAKDDIEKARNKPKSE